MVVAWSVSCGEIESNRVSSRLFSIDPTKKARFGNLRFAAEIDNRQGFWGGSKKAESGLIPYNAVLVSKGHEARPRMETKGSCQGG